MPRAPLWNRNFLLLYQGGLISALGDQAFLVATLLWTKQATQSASTVGVMMFAGGVTGLLMPLGGALADRYSRARLLALLDGVCGISVVALALLFFALGEAHPALVPAALAVTFVRGLCMALFHPIETALVPDLVSDTALPQANSLLESTFRLTILVGQILGGVLFRLFGAPLLLLVDGLSFLYSAASELAIHEPPRSLQDAEIQRPGIWSNLRQGLYFTGRVRGFRAYLAGATCVNFFLAALFVSLPFYVEDVLHESPDWYGFLLGGMGFGGIVGGLAAGRFRQPGMLRGTIQLIALVVISGCTLPLALVCSPWVAMAVLIAAWTCVGFHQVILTTLVQKRTPQHMRGRVFGFLAMIRHGLTPLGLAAFGLVIDKSSGRVADVLFWAGVAGGLISLLQILQPDYRWFFLGDETEVAAADRLT